MAGRMLGSAAMEFCKWKLNGRGRGPTEPTNVYLRREIAGKVGNSKKLVLGQTRHFGQVWPEMVVPFPTPFFFFFLVASLFAYMRIF